MGNRTFTHAFDGYAKLNSWVFKGGNATVQPTVSFTTKFIHTNFYKASCKAHDIAPYLLFQAADPPFSALQKFTEFLNGIDNTNINVFQLGNPNGKEEPEFAAFSDFWHQYQFNHSNLETVGKVAVPVPQGGVLESSGLPLPSSAHPVMEYGTSNYITYVSAMNPIPFFSSTIRIIRMKSLYHREQIAKISVDQVPYMHSFGLSQKHAIIFAHPMYVNLQKMLRTAEPVNSLDWFPDKPTVLYVVDIHTAKVIQLETTAIFMMHHVNSFEITNSQIVVDAITYPNINFVKSLQLKTLEDPKKRNSIGVDSKLKRFILNLKKKTVVIKDFPETAGAETVSNMDMPAINERYRHKSYCYTWGLVLKADNIHLDNVTLVKKDLCRKGRDKMWGIPGHIPSEPWFVPKPGARQEDDGFILSVVLNGPKAKSYLGIFNARTMRRVNRGYASTVIPFTLHGRFFPNLT